MSQFRFQQGETIRIAVTAVGADFTKPRCNLELSSYSATPTVAFDIETGETDQDLFLVLSADVSATLRPAGYVFNLAVNVGDSVVISDPQSITIDPTTTR